MAVTPGQTTVTDGASDTRSLHRRAASAVDLPAPADDLAAEAAAQLDWDGVALPQSTLLGRRVVLVARLRTEVHAERIAMGASPILDRATVATWTWPEFAATAPAPAAEIVGVLAVARHWRTGMAATVPFARYGEAAMVLPYSAVFSQDYVDNCLPRARTYGLGVVTADEDAVVDLDLAGRADRMLAPMDAVSRWVNEVAYEQLLAVGEVPANCG
ncbi:hypothetical protein [Amycolatopsis cihanbeyliensis]|uniref:Uncharacterized protein n=1 Tax=Amycolatopsis cihanbeyliensis TaxID=1128664 RepID=A0A542DLN0_AMYCI|nr:hypothetical protein [Amycolatopsis cihanbeyliensis]TQJ03979.1 hypothetical protein FB471_3756 [Amycolatopsis cihanbeyliensis]